jgi:metallo-beta-lactamase family protein
MDDTQEQRMRVQFLGATGTVTGSKYLLEYAGSRVLVDCGLFQGYKQLRLRNWAELPIDPRRIDAVVLTHAHLDHSGYLPLLAKQGFRGPVYCTHATRELCGILLPDSGHLLEEEAAYANRHTFSKHSPALPLYTKEDATRSLRLLRPVAWSTPIEVAPQMQAMFKPAGHIPGAACVRIAAGATSVLFSGDLGRPNDLLLLPPALPEPADYLVVESTYGDRLHPATDVLNQLADVILRTTRRGGAVIIPAFAVGRAQEIMHCIRLLKQAGTIPRDLPIFLNSPMADQATQVYAHLRDGLRLSVDELRSLAAVAHIVKSPDESRELNARRGPMVIIAASGMATGGRVVHHLKAFAPDERNTILLVGFQAGGTRGASLAAGAASIRIHGEDVPVRAEVARIDTLSAHADASEIEQWLRGFATAPKRTYITHGEPEAADALRQRIERSLGWPVTVPEYRDRVELD